MVGGKKKILSKKIVGRKNAGSYKTYEMSKSVEKRLAAYLNEMGVGQAVLETMKNTPASSIQQLAPYDMLQAKLVTSLDAVDLLTAPTLCNTDPVAANCREIPAPAGDVVAYAKPAPAAPVEPETGQRADVGDMRFVLVRGRSFLCDPNCPEWISAEGIISARTPERLRQLLDTIGDRRLPVVINSPGGDVLGALARRKVDPRTQARRGGCADGLHWMRAGQGGLHRRRRRPCRADDRCERRVWRGLPDHACRRCQAPCRSSRAVDRAPDWVGAAGQNLSQGYGGRIRSAGGDAVGAGLAPSAARTRDDAESRADDRAWFGR